MNVSKARIGDVPAMHRLINDFANQGAMLPRALSQIYENLRDYFVVRDGTKVVGCAALHVNWLDLAEIRSLAVEQNRQGEQLGATLVQACIEDAHSLGLPRVFCLTRQPGFFERQGFSLIDKSELPHKVWAECYYCPQFPDCDEVALIRSTANGD
ncbi:MAG: N-acetyltransferase [Dehalococcoidia bacterium]|nr:N-acetyltransferase [Dehalococcoidia bacterium]